MRINVLGPIVSREARALLWARGHSREGVKRVKWREQERPGFGLDARILDGTQGERRGVDEVRDTKEETGDVKT